MRTVGSLSNLCSHQVVGPRVPPCLAPSCAVNGLAGSLHLSSSFILSGHPHSFLPQVTDCLSVPWSQQLEPRGCPSYRSGLAHPCKPSSGRALHCPRFPGSSRKEVLSDALRKEGRQSAGLLELDMLVFHLAVSLWLPQRLLNSKPTCAEKADCGENVSQKQSDSP